jgi:hypothetical protein
MSNVRRILLRNGHGFEDPINRDRERELSLSSRREMTVMTRFYFVGRKKSGAQRPTLQNQLIVSIRSNNISLVGSVDQSVEARGRPEVISRKMTFCI